MPEGDWHARQPGDIVLKASLQANQWIRALKPVQKTFLPIHERILKVKL